MAPLILLNVLFFLFGAVCLAERISLRSHRPETAALSINRIVDHSSYGGARPLQSTTNDQGKESVSDHELLDIVLVATVDGKFHALNQAYELLLDPLRRLALDAKQRLKEARKVRYAQYDAKRKNMLDDLEERERAFKKSRMEKEE